MSVDTVNVRAVRAATRPVAGRLSDALAITAFASGVLTFVFGGLLTGPPVMNGSARGTALVIAVIAAPVLALSARLARERDSARSVVVWAGMAMFLTYNSFMLLFGTPLNRLFLLYVATFGLAVATMIAIAVTTDVNGIASRCRPTLPARPLAGYLWVIVALNSLAWLGRIVPAIVGDTTSELTDGMGLATVPTYVQDLAFWLPLLTLGALLLWKRDAWGFLIGGAGLSFWALEAVTVAVDQWFGHRADPTSDVASNAVVVPFLALAVIGTAALWLFLRHVHPAGDPHTSAAGRDH